MSVNLLSEHVAMVKERRVKNILLPSSATSLEKLPAAAAECSVAASVTPSGHKAVSLILAYLECRHLTDLPIRASFSLGLIYFAHYTLASSCKPFPRIIRWTSVCADIYTTVSVVLGSFKAPSVKGDLG